MLCFRKAFNILLHCQHFCCYFYYGEGLCRNVQMKQKVSVFLAFLNKWLFFSSAEATLFSNIAVAKTYFEKDGQRRKRVQKHVEKLFKMSIMSNFQMCGHLKGCKYDKRFLLTQYISTYLRIQDLYQKISFSLVIKTSKKKWVFFTFIFPLHIFRIN